MMWYKPDKRDAKNIGSKGNLGLPKDGLVTLEDKLKIKRNGHKNESKGCVLGETKYPNFDLLLTHVFKKKIES